MQSPVRKNCHFYHTTGCKRKFCNLLHEGRSKGYCSGFCGLSEKLCKYDFKCNLLSCCYQHSEIQYIRKDEQKSINDEGFQYNGYKYYEYNQHNKNNIIKKYEKTIQQPKEQKKVIKTVENRRSVTEIKNSHANKNYIIRRSGFKFIQYKVKNVDVSHEKNLANEHEANNVEKKPEADETSAKKEDITNSCNDTKKSEEDNSKELASEELGSCDSNYDTNWCFKNKVYQYIPKYEIKTLSEQGLSEEFEDFGKTYCEQKDIEIYEEVIQQSKPQIIRNVPNIKALYNATNKDTIFISNDQESYFIEGLYDIASTKYTNNYAFVDEVFPLVTSFNKFPYLGTQGKYVITNSHFINSLLTDPTVYSQLMELKEHADRPFEMITFSDDSNHWQKMQLLSHFLQESKKLLKIDINTVFLNENAMTHHARKSLLLTGNVICTNCMI